MYKRQTGGNDITQLETFFDLTCPDCKAAWPNVKQVADYYGPEKLTVRVHTLPLPYHRQAFPAAQAATAIGAQKESDFFVWLEAVFNVQDKFYNANSMNMSANDVNSAYALLASKTLAIDVAKVNDWLSLTSSYNEDARVSWKYAAFRGITGTPGFLVNGVAVNADPSWTLAEWRQVLDPLINPTISRNKLQQGACPAGTTECTYLPGKTQCCTAGEMCVTNVGCRC